MQLADFDFPFDPSLIANKPVHPRDHARLLVVSRTGGARQHKQVKDLPPLLQPGDVLVLNDTKVIPARLRGIKLPGGGQIEILLVREREEQVWEVLSHSLPINQFTHEITRGCLSCRGQVVRGNTNR